MKNKLSKKDRFQKGPVEIQGCQIVETLHSSLQSNRFEDPPHRVFIIFGQKEDENTFLSLREYIRIDSLSKELKEQIRKEIKDKEKTPQNVHSDTKKLSSVEIKNRKLPEKWEK